MGLVKEEDQFGLLQIADLRQSLEHLRQQPQQEGGVEPRRAHQLVCRQHIDHAVTARICLHEVVDIEHGLPEKLGAALGLELQQPSCNRADAGRTDVAVLGGVVLGVVTDMLQHGAQVFEVQQQQALVIGNLENQIENSRLGLIEAQHATQQQRAHVGNGGAHWVTLRAENVPQLRRAGLRLGQTQASFGQSGF